MATRRVVVTRPAADAARWVAALQAQAVAALALPLIELGAVADRQPLRAARARVNDFDALMFVSAAAVTHFFAEPGAALGPRTRCWSTGPGTSAALRAAGVPATAIDAPAQAAEQFDSEHLWPLVRAQAAPGKCILLVRGGDADGRPSGRPWLAQQIEDAGATLSVVVAYRRTAPAWDAARCAQARALADSGALWLFTSSEAVRHLAALLPGQSWRHGVALATHPRIAQAAQDIGFGQVHTVRPGLAVLIASIESIA